MFKRLSSTIALALCLLLPVARAAAQHGAMADPQAPAGSGGKTVHAADTHSDGHAPGRLLPIPPTKADVMAAVWVIIIFVVLLAILYPTAWKNVLAGLKRREERIRQDIANAEEARRRAEQTLGEYNAQLASAESRVRDMLTKAQADGERLATSIRMQAQKEAEEAKERATRDIDAAKNAALREVYEQTANLATNVAEKILRRNLNADDQRELVRQSLEQLQTIK